MIGKLIVGAAGTTGVLVGGGLGYRKVRQRRVAQKLAIATPNSIIEERFVTAGH